MLYLFQLNIVKLGIFKKIYTILSGKPRLYKIII